MGETSGEEEKAQVHTEQNDNMKEAQTIWLLFLKVHVCLIDTWSCLDGKICTRHWQTTSTSLISRRTDWTIWWSSWSRFVFTTNLLRKLQPAKQRRRVQGKTLLERNLKTRLKSWIKSGLFKTRFCSWQFGQWAWEFKEGATGVQAGLHTTEDCFQMSRYYFCFFAWNKEIYLWISQLTPTCFSSGQDITWKTVPAA